MRPAIYERPDCERGQALLVALGGLFVLMLGASVLFWFGSALADRGRVQRAADLAALSATRSMRDDLPRLYEPPAIDGRPNPYRLSEAQYLARARRAAITIAHANGERVHLADVTFPDEGGFAPSRVKVVVRGEAAVRGDSVPVKAVAQAEIVSPIDDGAALEASGGGYSGPLAYRQGKPMRPDVARAFDRMNAAARADGVSLIITSGYRSDAEQAELYKRHPDPKWVAPPGKSLHRFGTELDLGPPAAYDWLARNARRFHFIKRYPWEPWHYGYGLNARSAPPRPEGRSAVPSFVPAAYRDSIARAASRWNVSAALLAAQIYAESGFNPFAVSPAGARGIAQFMPGTARSYGLRDPFDPHRSIDAQARLMRDLLRQFASVSLALAAYNAGPAPVARCGCVPPYPETRAYVVKVIALMGAAGDLLPGGESLEVRLVE
jgi:hypothetical protein